MTKPTLEQRMRRLEWTVRLLLVVLVLDTSVSALHAVSLYLPYWVTNAAGQATYGDNVHHTGATVDVIGLPDAAGGLSVLGQDETDESFLIQGFLRPDGSHLKTMSISTKWAKQQTTPPGVGDATGGRILLTNYNTVFVGDSKRPASDDVWGTACGGYGFMFFADSPYNAAECPGRKQLSVNGDIVVARDIHVSGRLFVNGQEVRP